MGKYTLEVRELLQDPKFTLFDFEYNFYLDSHKKIFEEKFIDEYFYSEIGQETVYRFKERLRTKLNSINDYYMQLYKTQLESEGINFLLNKDLEETYSKNVSSDMTTKNDTSSLYKESNIDNGNADVELNSNNLTNVNSNTDNSNGDVRSSGNEEFKLISKGNIGTTSSAQLLRDYRSILINIDGLIIDECRELFMGVF